MEARNAGPGPGSEFVVRLPLAEASAPSLEAAKPPALLTEGRGPRFLIVDDNRDGARSLAIMHTRQEHIMETAFEGPDAMRAATTFFRK